MLMSGRIIPTILGREEISRIWATAHSLGFLTGLLHGVTRSQTDWATELNWTRAVMAPLGVSFHLLIQGQGLVLSAPFLPLDSNQFMLCPWAMSFFQKLCPTAFPLVTHPQRPLQFQDDHKGQKMGNGPISGNSHSFLKISGILISLISLWNYQSL